MSELLGNLKFNIKTFMVIFTALIVAFIIWIVAYKKIPTENRDIFIMLATIVVKDSFGRVYRFLFPDKEEKPKAS